jgi:hypothetical protein
MAARGTSNPVHPVRTTRSGFRYFFADKHHGRGGPDDGQSHAPLSRDEEFGIFDQSDLLSLCDDASNLYGILRDARGRARTLGTREEQLAFFPNPSKKNPPEAGSLWHGYPRWPIRVRTLKRATQPYGPSRDVLYKMMNQRLMTSHDCARLLKGKTI